ncbi:MAG: DUF3352 domain-containing protein [Phormidesmis sp.]
MTPPSNTEANTAKSTSSPKTGSPKTDSPKTDSPKTDSPGTGSLGTNSPGTGSAASEAGGRTSAGQALKRIPKLAIVWAAVLLGGGAIAYFNFSQHAPRSLSPAGTQLVPQTALGTITLTTDELTWTKLRQFGTPDTQAQLDSLLNQWTSELFTAKGYSFKRDIKPWIGDRVTLAILPAQSAASESTSPTPESALANEGLAAATQNLVLVVPIADPLKAKELLTRRLMTAEEETAEEETAEEETAEGESRSYRGITVQTIESENGQALESAVIGTDWLLLSNTAQGIEQAIDTHRGRQSLLDNANYRKAERQIESPQPRGKNFAQIYLNIPAVTQALAPSTGALNRPQGSIVPLQGSEGIVATALIQADGIRFEGTSWLSPKDDLAYGEMRNEAGEMPRHLPGNTLLAMTGSNLQQFWRGFSESNTSPPFFPDPQNLKAGLLTQTGLDIDEDIMPWAAGEFALGLLPPVAAAEADLEPGSGSAPAIASAPLVMMVKTNDRQTAESVWAQIDDVIVNRYRYQVETTEFDGGSITEWISPFQGVKFSHGWLPGNIAFFAVGDRAAEAIAPTPDQPLSTTRLFQTLTGNVPQPNNGHFYLNLEQINALGGVFPLPQIPAEGPTTAIQAIGLTTAVSDRTMDYNLYIKLAKTTKANPLTDALPNPLANPPTNPPADPE